MIWLFLFVGCYKFVWAEMPVNASNPVGTKIVPVYRCIRADSVPEPAVALMPIVTVSEHRLPSVPGTYAWPTEALHSGGVTTVADLLNNESGVFIKSYGSGSLATSSYRGGGAGHLAVTWNGLPLENPMLGLLDLSLLPLDLIDAAVLRPGGASTVWGSGAVSGVLSLATTVPRESGWKLKTDVGSFGNVGNLLENTGVGKDKRWSVRTRLSQRSAKNDFPYRLPPDTALYRQQHASLHQLAATQSINFFPRKQERIGLQLWFNHTERELPPTTTQRFSAATQADAQLRLALDWERIGENTRSAAKLGYFRESIDYRDPLFGGEAYSVFRRLLLETDHQRFVGQHHDFSFGISGQFVTADINAYGARVDQLRLAPSLRHRVSVAGWELSTALRAATVDGGFLPPVPSVSLVYVPVPGWRFSVSWNRVFRLPTLNDLYWRPGGNPDLKPESGASVELGVSHVYSGPNWQLSLQGTAFHRRLRNWIQWAPDEEGPFWSATNLTRVRSRGLEQRFRFSRSTKAGNWKFELGHDYVESTNEVEISLPRMRAGEQLWYVPRHRARIAIGWSLGKFSVRYGHTYTSTVRGISGTELSDYQIGRINLNYGLTVGGQRLSISTRLDNCWNHNYRVIEQRVMPGRSWGVSISWTGTSKN